MVFVIPLPVRLRERKKHFSSLLRRLLAGRVGEEDRDYHIEHRRHIRVSTVVKVKVYRVHVVEKKVQIWTTKK